MYRLHTLALLVFVCAFQVWAARTYTVFDDEALSCLRYTLPLGEMVSALWHGAEPDPPLYYVLQNLWVRVFGVGPLGLRGLSIVFFLTGLLFMRQAAFHWFDARSANLTLLVCALHPAHLFFGFAGRWYAAMFCAVAVLLYVTARIGHSARTQRATFLPYLAWAAAAAAVCYVNYFGPVVVGLILLVMLLRRTSLPFSTNRAATVREGLSRKHEEDAMTRSMRPSTSNADRSLTVAALTVSRRRWLLAGLVAAMFYAPWFPPFWRQLVSFPKVAGPSSEMLSSAGRTLMALAAGNLASVRAWWVWLPMAVLAVTLLIMLTRQWRRVWPMAIIALGCLLAGVLTRVMIDKYIMTFSGVACLLAVGVASEEWRTGKRILPRIAGAALALGWMGCGVNLVTQSNWSSLRWLDPFEAVVAEHLHSDAAPPVRDWVVGHPAGRYYIARAMVSGDTKPWRVDPAAWRRHAATDAADDAAGPATPETMLSRMAADPPPRVLVLQTAGFADDPHARHLEAVLAANYRMKLERGYLEDPDAALKDRIDPQYVHPPWRITVQIWRRD